MASTPSTASSSAVSRLDLESVWGVPSAPFFVATPQPARAGLSLASLLGSSRSAPAPAACAGLPPWLPSMTAPVGSGNQVSNQGVGLLPANWYRGYSSSLADAVHEGRKEQGIKMPWEFGPISVVFGLSRERFPTFKYPRLINPLPSFPGRTFLCYTTNLFSGRPCASGTT